ncbi:MAG: methionyl-tRNA formyltransferase [Planctomycetes bacterium]|nr:methionyl-tRNA formyltransferase [Planctomycetota bacterium]
MKILFFGTSDYALPSLRAMVEAGFVPQLVVTKPDSPRGRGRKIYPQEVRLESEQLGLDCAQPKDVHDPEFMKKLAAVGADIGVVVSYGVIMKPELYDLPAKGCINAHASLLPLYRGAAPIQPAIRDGRDETGVTIFRLADGIDTGDILLAEKHPIDPKATAGSLYKELSELSGKAVVKALQRIDAGKDTYTPQDHAKATVAPKIEKADGIIDWSKTAEEIELLVRAMSPKPGGQTRLGSRRFIVMEGEVEPDYYGLGVTGAIQSAGEEGIRVCTGKELYRITTIKPENGRRMTAGEWVRGHPLPPDARFG